MEAEAGRNGGEEEDDGLIHLTTKGPQMIEFALGIRGMMDLLLHLNHDHNICGGCLLQAFLIELFKIDPEIRDKVVEVMGLNPEHIADAPSWLEALRGLDDDEEEVAETHPH